MKATKKRSGKGAAASNAVSIADEEWDFTNCPDEELFACAFYEYARNAPIWVSFAKAIYKLPDFESIPKALEEPSGSRLFYRWIPHRWTFAFPAFFALFHEFPKKCWLKISPAERTRRLKVFTEGINLRRNPVAPLPPLCQRSNWASHPVGFLSYGSPAHRSPPSEGGILERFDGPVNTSTFEFEICWDSPDGEIIANFTRWLKKNRPTPEPVRRKGKKQTQPDMLRIRLRELGAMRLLARFTVNEADAYTKGILQRASKQIAPFQGTPRSWWRAKHNAEELLAKFSLSGLPIGDRDGPSDTLSLLLGTAESEVWQEMAAYREQHASMRDARWWQNYQHRKKISTGT